MGRLMKVDLW